MNEQLKQAIEDHVAKLLNEGFVYNLYQKVAESTVSTPSILRHCDPEIMKQAGWVREGKYQKAVDGLKKCMNELKFPRSFAQAALFDLHELPQPPKQ